MFFRKASHDFSNVLVWIGLKTTNRIASCGTIKDMGFYKTHIIIQSKAITFLEEKVLLHCAERSEVCLAYIQKRQLLQ